MEEMIAPPGLAGVVVADTTVGQVRGQEGFYHYREYDATELARHRTLEDVWYLLLHGALPDHDRAEAFDRRVRDARALPEGTAALVPGVAALSDKAASLADVRTVVSALAAELGIGASLDVDSDTLIDQTVRIAATMPTIVAALWRHRQGHEPIAPDPSLPLAANYLKMLTGRTPDPAVARAVEQYLITTADHGFNASTFAARVVTSTGADVGAAMVAGLGALSGPLHGGAPSRALDMLDEIGTPDHAEAWIREAIARGERIMGFGHRVYKTQDPRAALLRETAAALGGDTIELALEVERTAVEILGELKPGRDLYANVEFYAAVLLDRCGLPRELFTPTFAVSRTIGWSAHVAEQHAAGRLIRPTARYLGPTPPVPVPPRG